MSDFDHLAFVKHNAFITAQQNPLNKPRVIIPDFWKAFSETILMHVAHPEILDDLLGKGNWRRGHKRFELEFRSEKHLALFLLTYKD